MMLTLLLRGRWFWMKGGGSLWITDGHKIMKSTEGMSPKTEKMVSILALLVPLSRGLVMRCAWHKLKRFSCLVLWYKIYQLIPLVWIMKTWVFRTFCLKIGGCYQVAEWDYRICRGMKWNDDYAKLRDSWTLVSSYSNPNLTTCRSIYSEARVV